MNDFKISAICIVKNEEDNIKQSIESYKDIVDEIIIVDTGCEDNTIDICKELGCTIYEEKWNDDFSEIKNKAIKKAKYPYILFLDADEYFCPKLENSDKELIKNMIDNDNVKGIKFFTYNIDKQNGQTLYISHNLRFFVNNPNLLYRRKVHEVLEIENNKIETSSCVDIHLFNIGNTETDIVNNAQRDIRILNSIDDKEPIDYFYLAKAYFYLSNYELSNKYCDIFLEQDNVDDIIKTNDYAYMVYLYKYYNLKEVYGNKYSQEIDKIFKIMLDKIPHIPQVYYELAEYEYDRNFEKAYDYYVKSIKLNNEFDLLYDYVNMRSLYEPELYYKLSYLDYMFGNKERAKTRATVSCLLNKSSVPYLVNLLKIIKNKDPIKVIDEIYRIYNPSITSDYNVIITALSYTKLNSVFLHFLYEYNNKYNGGSRLVYIGMMLTNQSKFAIETALSIYDKKKNIEDEFMAALAILYSNDREYYNQYIDKFDCRFKNILRFHFDDDVKLSEYESFLYMHLFIRMYFVGRERSLKFSIDYFSYNEIALLINSLKGVGDYKNIANLCKHILEQNIDNEELNCVAYYNLIFGLFATHKYEDIVGLYSKYSQYSGYNIEILDFMLRYSYRKL